MTCFAPEAEREGEVDGEVEDEFDGQKDEEWEQIDEVGPGE